MKLSDFDYVLPKELIAQKPTSPRDASRMMVVPLDGGALQHLHFFDLPDFLGPHDVLVFNQSKVIPARILFQYHERECELFFLRVLPDGPRDGMWEVMVRPGRFFPVGAQFSIDSQVSIEVVAVSGEDGHRHVRVTDSLGRNTFEILEDIGTIPLPPYITSREGEGSYQTVYAKDPGSVAAPTAGFHFTEEMLRRLADKGVQIEYVTLHVGAGTFLPVKTEEVEEHVMHEEYFDIAPEVAERLVHAKKAGKRIIAVGTTSNRTLESCFMDLDHPVLTGETKLFIYPGYRFRFVDGLVTNFHLPKSTLLMLVSALLGRERTLECYQVAIEMSYRFFSFGDGMLLL